MRGMNLDHVKATTPISILIEVRGVTYMEVHSKAINEENILSLECMHVPGRPAFNSSLSVYLLCETLFGVLSHQFMHFPRGIVLFYQVHINSARAPL